MGAFCAAASIESVPELKPKSMLPAVVPSSVCRPFGMLMKLTCRCSLAKNPSCWATYGPRKITLGGDSAIPTFTVAHALPPEPDPPDDPAPAEPHAATASANAAAPAAAHPA